ncbi:hypothetical protein GCM10010359_04420 [Streptomyces morookaense]|nr:hypothetical protein GCM10010359_04420 [Streptomyces morookaense]
MDAHTAHDTDELASLLRSGTADRERPTLITIRTTKVSVWPVPYLAGPAGPASVRRVARATGSSRCSWIPVWTSSPPHTEV